MDVRVGLKAERRRIDAFELWCWRRLLRVCWTARRFNQSILKEISPGCSLEGLMLKLKLQSLVTWCEELTHLKRSWCWERFGQDKKGMTDGCRASLTQWTLVWVDSGSWWWTGRPGVLRFMGSHRVGHDWATELNWNIISFALLLIYFSQLALIFSYINVNLRRYLESTNDVIEILLYLHYSRGNKRPDSILSLKLHQLKSNVRLELCYQSFVVFIKHDEI